MTPDSKRELVLAVRRRYRKASKTEKTRILDEFVANTGYHRKYAIRLLKQGPAVRSTVSRTGQPRVYTSEVDRALRFIWEVCDHIRGKRLQPFLPEMMTVLERHGELVLPDAAQVLLCQMSAATIDRHLAPAHRRLPQRDFTYGHQAGEPAQAPDSHPCWHRVGGTATRLCRGRPRSA